MSPLMHIRRRHAAPDTGFTLVELLVAMMLFTVVLAIVTSGMLVMQRGLRKAQGQSDNLDASRTVIQLLDRQVRYANTITQPGPGATPTTTYIEWQTGDTNQPQTCTQWRFDSVAGTLGYRTWPVASPTPTAWTEKAFGVVAVSGTPVFATTALAVGQTAPDNGPSHAGVTVVFAVRHGADRSTTSKSQVTLTAINTNGIGTGSTVCNQVSRP